MTVIVARADDSFSRILREAGIEVINLEMIKTQVNEDLAEFENRISRLDEYDGVFFTSPVAARVFAGRVESRLTPTIYTLGARATRVLVDAGFAVKTIADANTADEMLAAFDEDEFAGKKLLFVKGELSTRTIQARLADVDETAVYHTIEIDPSGDAATDIRRGIASGEIAWSCFFSPSAVEAFEKRFGNGVRVAAIGETTAARARTLGFKIGLTASRATNETFAAELIETLRNDKRD